jgi:uncharacterized protein (TIGR00251 family)
MHDPQRQRLLLSVHLQPGAKSSAIAGAHGDALKIRIAAPAVDNKANAALVAFLSTALGIPAADIGIRSGLHARRKRIEIRGATERVAAHVRAALTAAPD